MCTSDYECVEKLLTNLSVIGKIEEGKKVNTKGKYIELDDTTFLQPFWRWYRGDSRIYMANKIREVINGSSNIMKKAIEDIKNNDDSLKKIYLDANPRSFLVDLKEILKTTERGVKNLRDTYLYDNTLSSKLEMDVKSVNRQISTINEVLGIIDDENSSTFDDTSSVRRLSEDFYANSPKFNKKNKKGN